MSLPPVNASAVHEAFGNSRIGGFIGRIMLSFPDRSLMFPLLCVSLIVFLIVFSQKPVSKPTPATIILSLLFAFSMTFGSLLEQSSMPLCELLSGASQIVKIAASYASWFVIGYTVINRLIFMQMPQQHAHKASLDRFLRLAPAIIAICWLPLLIASYPGVWMGDTGSQVNQFFGIDNYTSSFIIPLSPDVLLNQHHPVAHTILVGICMKLGNALFGSYEFGFFLYTLLQWITMVATLSYALFYLGKRGISQIVQLIVLCVILLLPFFSNLSVLATKDAIFSCGIIWFTLMVDRVCHFGPSRGSAIFLVLSALTAAFFRNGIIVGVLLALAFAVLSGNSKRDKSLRLLFASIGTGILLTYIVVTSVVFPALNITPGSQREMFSLPIQQISAVVKQHGDELSSEEQRAISNVLDYETIADAYNPDLADPVKKTWNKYASAEEVQEFLRVWVSLIIQYPSTCLEATMRNYYGFLYPTTRALGGNSTEFSIQCMERNNADIHFGFDLTRPGWANLICNLYDAYYIYIEQFPGISVLTTSAFWVWLLLVCLVKAFRSNNTVRFGLILVLVALLITLIGPCNGTYIRYTFPIILTMTFAAPLVFQAQRN